MKLTGILEEQPLTLEIIPVLVCVYIHVCGAQLDPTPVGSGQDTDDTEMNHVLLPASKELISL